MGKRLNLFWRKEKNYMQLASINCKAISEYNEKILSALTLIGGLLMMLPQDKNTQYSTSIDISIVIKYNIGNITN
ncbi:MAG: hypothetical protein PHE94_01815 [Eubacteriales bacterium]|nr:hypothetical protein [Eubacteriales bacterium]MDD4121616.1 hypothetical protein [Eubacteriales bacterium]